MTDTHLKVKTFTPTSAPEPDSGLRTREGPRKLPGPPGEAPPCAKIKSNEPPRKSRTGFRSGSWIRITCVCQNRTSLLRSCRWRSCSVPLLCKGTRPQTQLAVPADPSGPGTGHPETGTGRDQHLKSITHKPRPPLLSAVRLANERAAAWIVLKET